MELTVHVYHHLVSDDSALRKLDEIIALVKKDIQMDANLQAAMDNLVTQVTNETTVEAGVVTTLNNISGQITALQQQLASATSPADVAVITQKLSDLAGAVQSSSSALAAAAAAVPPTA